MIMVTLPQYIYLTLVSCKIRLMSWLRDPPNYIPLPLPILLYVQYDPPHVYTDIVCTVNTKQTDNYKMNTERVLTA